MNMALSRRKKYNGNRNGEDHSSFYGDILKDARERHGLDLDSVSEELHVRKDILEALENGDFNQIPPQGYSRNMVKSYSRLLGLDANKLTNMFLDSEYSYQVSKKRASVQRISDENKKRVPNIDDQRSKSLTPRERIESRRTSNIDHNKIVQKPENTNNFKSNRTFHTYENKYRNTPRQRGSFDTKVNSFTGSMSYKSNSAVSNDLLNGTDQDSARQRLASRKKQIDQQADKNQQNPYKQAKLGFGALKKRHTINRNNSYNLTEDENPNTIGNKPQKNSSSGSYQFMQIHKNNANSSQSKLTIPIIIGAVVFLLIVLIVVFFLVGKQHENDKTDVSKLNVVGITDVENPNKNDNQNNNNNESKNHVEVPKEVEFKYKVKTGQNVYMEIYEGNNARPTVAREVKSDETNTFKVIDTLKFVTSNPAAVDIFVNNEAVSPQGNDAGVYTYTVDYNEFIKQWKAKNPNAKQ